MWAGAEPRQRAGAEQVTAGETALRPDDSLKLAGVGRLVGEDPMAPAMLVSRVRQRLPLAPAFLAHGGT